LSNKFIVLASQAGAWKNNSSTVLESSGNIRPLVVTWQPKSKKLKGKIDSLKNQLGSSEIVLAKIKKIIMDSNAEAKTYQDGMDENAATAVKKITARQADLAAAKAETAEFLGSRLYINVGLIRADIKVYLKNLGLVKD
jgi:hypothetical protein